MFRRETRGFRRLEFSCSPNQLSGVPALNQPHILLDQWRAQFSLDEQTANQCSRGFECPEADTGSTSVQQQQQQDGELARRDDDISADDTPSSHCRDVSSVSENDFTCPNYFCSNVNVSCDK
ncbi:uncharacterized protein LOC144050642 isoform X3 [Vanacampus margaritifer]